MEPLWLHKHKPKGAVEGANGAICLNGSPGSLKSSFSFVCEYFFYHCFYLIQIAY